MNLADAETTTGTAATKAVSATKTGWTLDAARDLYANSFPDLLYRAQTVHRENFDPADVQLSTLLNIKSGACPEDCGYCSQSARYKTGLKAEPLMDPETVFAAARKARENGATRFCMGAAWRNPRDKDLQRVKSMIEGVKALGLETCATLGMLTDGQAVELKQAGLDYYNHNIDTSQDYYPEVISTRTFQDRLDTLKSVREAGIAVCCGGIVGMGEGVDDRLKMLVTLANLDPAPESVPINQLVPSDGTPLAGSERVDSLDFVRLVAVARIMMPSSRVRLSAGRHAMDDAAQALCFLAGANSIFYGEKLLTTDNADIESDQALFARLGINGSSATGGRSESE
ncbi:MAG: biotin synthase BioB [Proteobacteria bacterium]|nr:MAG: biotin synthase BioB [Pseudomonadota bacterium]